jgi:peptidoglycan lytic transglycosylase
MDNKNSPVRDLLTLILIIVITFISCSVDRSLRNKRFAESATGIDAHSVNDDFITGVSSYYGRKFHGRKTASGETFNMYDYTAAHKTLPFGTLLEVENLSNNKKVVVRVNDRGPFVKDRVLDISYAAAEQIDMIKSGTAKIVAKIIQRPKK